MKRKYIGTAAAVGSIAVVGYFLVPLVAAWSITLFPPAADGVTPLVRMAILNHVLPGLAVGIILGVAAVVLSPIRSVFVLTLPAIIVFLAYLVLQMTLYPIDWNTRVVLTLLLPEWTAFIIGASGVAIIGGTRRGANQTSHATSEPARNAGSSAHEG
jgi:hypothetical protein